LAQSNQSTNESIKTLMFTYVDRRRWNIVVKKDGRAPITEEWNKINIFGTKRKINISSFRGCKLHFCSSNGSKMAQKWPQVA
jgi:hypothetical protein